MLCVSLWVSVGMGCQIRITKPNGYPARPDLWVGIRSRAHHIFTSNNGSVASL